MKKSLNLVMIFSLIFIFILVSILIFSHWQLKLQENRLDEVQGVVVENSQISTAIVNFINTSLDELQN